MNDEEIIVAYPHEIKFIDKNGGAISYYVDRKVSDCVKELQDKLSKIESENRQKDIDNLQLQSNWNSLRELIKWKPIEEYDENKYDWVLVKYYDGDYECVPTVAERRKGTNKWYDTNNNEIIFEVKYFFDMQLLDKMNELEGKDKE